MSERVEEIRRQHGETTGHDARSLHVEPSCDICALLAALAQAEREREGETLRANMYLDKIKGLRAEVEQLVELARAAPLSAAIWERGYNAAIEHMRAALEGR